MTLQEVRNLVESTADPAFAVDDTGVIIAWNAALTELLGITREQAQGKLCREILQGADECGPLCGEDCVVRQAVRREIPVKNFDIQIATPKGKRWCNISVLQAKSPRSVYPYALHIIRSVDLQKKLELTVRDFLVHEINSTEKGQELIPSTRSAAGLTELTAREKQILKLLATGSTSASLAKQLHISRTTVNNHIQHILRKLNCHTRLEAIRRAEHAGLI